MLGHPCVFLFLSKSLQLLLLLSTIGCLLKLRHTFKVRHVSSGKGELVKSFKNRFLSTLNDRLGHLFNLGFELVKLFVDGHFIL